MVRARSAAQRWPRTLVVSGEYAEQGEQPKEEQMNDSDRTLLLSLWRTFVPYLVGYIGAQLAEYGLNIDEASLTALLTLMLGTAYYALGRWLEQNHSNAWGWLLGYTKQPEYTRGRHRSLNTTTMEERSGPVDSAASHVAGHVHPDQTDR